MSSASGMDDDPAGGFMIEIARFVLAAIVAQTHLMPFHDEWLGQQAVFAFYTLSGYLMTRVLNTRYGFSATGTVAFLLNRVLRLWPAYLVVLGLTMLASLLVPLGPNRIPHTLLDMLTSLTIIGQTKFDLLARSGALPVLTSWSLSIELTCYLLLAVYFARSAKRLVLFALLGALAISLSTVHCALSANPARYGPFCYQNRYGVIQAGFIPFAAGGLIYFYFAPLTKWLARNVKAVLAGLAVLELSCVGSSFVAINFATFVGIPVMAFIVLCRPNDPLTRTTDFFGRASYHLFIAHMTIGPVLAALLHSPRFPMLFMAIILGLTVAVSLGLSAFLVPLELRIEVVRRRISLSKRTWRVSAASQRIAAPIAFAPLQSVILREAPEGRTREQLVFEGESGSRCRQSSVQ